jgi:hypothetical protein
MPWVSATVAASGVPTRGLRRSASASASGRKSSVTSAASTSASRLRAVGGAASASRGTSIEGATRSTKSSRPGVAPVRAASQIRWLSAQTASSVKATRAAERREASSRRPRHMRGDQPGVASAAGPGSPRTPIVTSQCHAPSGARRAAQRNGASRSMVGSS